VKTLISKLHPVLIVLLFLQAGCAVKKTIKLPDTQRLLPAQNATRSALLEHLQEKSTQIETLKGTVTFDFSRGGAKTGVLDEYRQTKGYVFVERPDRIRVQVQLPIVLTTVAVMVSDGQEYRVSIPIKNQFAILDVNAPVDPKNSLSSLRPRIFLDGLIVNVMPYIDKPSVSRLFEEAVIGVHSYYVFSFLDTAGPELELLEKIWIDRTDLQVARKQVFAKEGRLETDVEYENYKVQDGISYPQVVVINRPVEEITVKMTFQQTTVNEKLDAKVFDLPRPEGSELVQRTN
jgi:outer membrane lipoprotein-sorting protein